MLRHALVACVVAGSTCAAVTGFAERPTAGPELPFTADRPLVVLSATGDQRDGQPVVVPHPEPAPYLSVLTRGYSGRLLRLYQLAQQFAHPGRAPQPAYLVLSDNQGGFPRFGFHLEGQRPSTASVDLHQADWSARLPSAPRIGMAPSTSVSARRARSSMTVTPLG
jgi:hypothetical protein